MQNLRPQPRPSELEFEFYQGPPEINMHINVSCHCTVVAGTSFDKGRSHTTQKKHGHKRPLNI